MHQKTNSVRTSGEFWRLTPLAQLPQMTSAAPIKSFQKTPGKINQQPKKKKFHPMFPFAQMHAFNCILRNKSKQQ